MPIDSNVEINSINSKQLMFEIKGYVWEGGSCFIMVFFYPNHALCVTENGYQTDKAKSVALAGEYSRPGSRKQVEQKAQAYRLWQISASRQLY